MDFTALIYYAIICGGLSAVAPRFGTVFARLGTGVAVGIAAALALPMIRLLFNL